MTVTENTGSNVNLRWVTSCQDFNCINYNAGDPETLTLTNNSGADAYLYLVVSDLGGPNDLELSFSSP